MFNKSYWRQQWKQNLNTLLNFSFGQYMHGQHPVVHSRSFHSNQHLPPHMSSRMTCSRSASFSGIQSSHLDAGVGAMLSVDGVQSVVYSSEHAVSSRRYGWETHGHEKDSDNCRMFPKKAMDVWFELSRSVRSMLELNEHASDFYLFNILIYTGSVNVTKRIIPLFLVLDNRSLGIVPQK